MVRIAGDHVEQLVAEHRQLLRRRAACLLDSVGAEQHLVHHTIVDGDEQPLLGADVVVERALAEPVRLAELGGARGVVAALGDELRRAVDDVLAALGATWRCDGLGRWLRLEPSLEPSGGLTGRIDDGTSLFLFRPVR